MKLQISNESPSQWDTFINKNSGILTQTTHWALLYERISGAKPIYITVIEEKNKIIAQLLYLKTLIGGYTFPMPNLFGLRDILTKSNFYTTITSHMGPTFIHSISQAKKQKVVRLLLKQILKEKNNIGPFTLLYTESSSDVNQLIRSFHLKNTLKLCATRKIDLSHAEISLSFLDKKRRNDRKYISTKGLTVKEVSSSRYHNHLQKTWKKKNLQMAGKNFYKELEATGKIKFFLSFKDTTVLAGSAIMITEHTGLEFSMFTTDASRKLNLRGGGGDFLKFYVFEFCIHNRILLLDLNMIDVRNMSDKTHNISQFKLKWGGQTQYGLEIQRKNIYIQSVINVIRKFKTFN